MFGAGLVAVLSLSAVALFDLAWGDAWVLLVSILVGSPMLLMLSAIASSLTLSLKKWGSTCAIDCFAVTVADFNFCHRGGGFICHRHECFTDIGIAIGRQYHGGIDCALGGELCAKNGMDELLSRLLNLSVKAVMRE